MEQQSQDFNFTHLEAIQQHIEDRRYDQFEQSMKLIYDEIMLLNAWKSFSGKMYAQYKRELNEQKRKAYENLIFSQRSVGKEIPPSIAKDYVAAKCGELQYMFDFAERVNSNCAYCIDSLRSILSALKAELASNLL